MKKLFLYFFVLVSLGEIVSIILSFDALHFISKPLIMVTLGVFYFYSVPKSDRSKPLILAVIFSFVGDVLLMLQDRSSQNFMLGLFAFLLSHILYILAYRQHRFEESTNTLQGIQRVRLAFPIILAGTGLIVVLYPSLENLKFPVVIYAITLILMVLNALFRYGYTHQKSFWTVFVGAVLFMISDSVLAIDKFLQPISRGSLIVMLTYITAQYLIVSGLIKHTSKN